MRDDEIVSVFRQRNLANIRRDEVYLRVSHLSPRQFNHPFACFDTIHGHSRISPNELGEETSIPLTDNEDAARPPDLPHERDASLLELVPENDRLEPAIRRRDAIEIHRRAMGSRMSGVSKTRSASAVRLSRGRPGAKSSLTSRNALAPRQSQSSQANRQKTAQASAARASA